MSLIFMTLLFSCQSNNTLEKEKSVEIPELLTRSEKIQLGKEWDATQSNYMKYKLKLQENEKDNETKILLANLYIQEARVTGEHGHYYPAALNVLNSALSDNELKDDLKFVALTTKAGVMLSLHEFQEALEIGNKALVMNPANAQIYGVLIDANVELGEYEKAIALSDRMIAIKPDIRSYSRISYLREIHGDIQGSKDALSLAVKAGFPGNEDTAWAMLTLGDLYRLYGDLDKAESIYNQILSVRTDYPFAVGALGDLEMEKGDYVAAEETLKEAMDIIPEVGFYVSMAHLYKEQERDEKFNQLMEEIFLMLDDDVNSGHNMNMEYISIHLDLLEDPEGALEYAKKEYEKRPKNIDVNRAMAKIYMHLDRPELVAKHLEVAKSTNSKHPELEDIKKVIL